MTRYAKTMSQAVAEVQVRELKMNDPKLMKVFDKLKPRDTVKIKHSSTLERGKDFIEYTVRSKNTLRNGVEKITLARKDSPTSVKRFLYKRDNKVTFAVGDMAASIDAIKEEVIDEIVVEEPIHPDEQEYIEDIINDIQRSRFNNIKNLIKQTKADKESDTAKGDVRDFTDLMKMASKIKIGRGNTHMDRELRAFNKKLRTMDSYPRDLFAAALEADVGEDAYDYLMMTYVESNLGENLDEQFDFVLLDKDNKIVGRYSGKNAKKEAESSKKSAHLPPMRIPKNEVGKMKIVPISPKDKKGIGDMVLAIGEEVELAEAKDIKILVKDVKDRNFLKDLLNKAKDEKVMVGSPTPADKKAGRYTFVGPKDKVNNVFNYAFDKSINRGNYAPATMMHEGASEMLDEISRANANKVNSELSKILGKIRFTHFYQMGPKAIFKLPKNVKHEVVVNRNDMKDAADLLMKDKGDVGFMFKQGQLRLAKAMDSNVVEENELINKAAGYISHMQMAERIDPADIDDTASEKDIENAAKNIIMQLRKSVSMRGNKDVEFADGKQKVDMRIAQKAIDMHMRMKPQDKLKFQNTIATSYKSLLNAIKGK